MTRKPALAAPRILALVGIAAAAIALAGCATTTKQRSFTSPQQAVDVTIAAVRSDDTKSLDAIFGPQNKDLFASGDPVADSDRRQRFLQAYDEKHGLVPDKGGMVLVIGPQDWPYPIPLVKKDHSWVFDVAQGREEILNRRIGQDELYTMQVCLALVDAQREYAETDRDGSGILAYATRFVSTPGTRDGLYWPVKEGEPLSPLGLLAAQAENVSYRGRLSGDGQPQPFHGYYYRMLTAQGKDAPGGAYSYMADGKMIGGFAAVAYPASYGNSGVMTFIVSNDGTVYQKDLGPDTERIAASMTEFNPDTTWTSIAKVD